MVARVWTCGQVPHESTGETGESLHALTSGGGIVVGPPRRSYVSRTLLSEPSSVTTSTRFGPRAPSAGDEVRRGDDDPRVGHREPEALPQPCAVSDRGRDQACGRGRRHHHGHACPAPPARGGERRGREQRKGDDRGVADHRERAVHLVARPAVQGCRGDADRADTVTTPRSTRDRRAPHAARSRTRRRRSRRPRSCPSCQLRRRLPTAARSLIAPSTAEYPDVAAPATAQDATNTTGRPHRRAQGAARAA